jgi:hypothetical protein
MRYAFAVLSAVASFALARPAGALIIVDYAFDSTSKLSIVSPPVDIPPQGTLTGGVRITYTSNSAGEIVSGPATLDLLNLSANLNVSTTFGSPVTVTGPASATLRSPVAGMFDGDQLTFAGAMGSFHAFGEITCTGAICSVVQLPSGSAFPFDTIGSIALPDFTIASIHGSLMGLNFGGITANLTFNGPETGRQIPEPAVAELFTLAVAGLALRRARS